MSYICRAKYPVTSTSLYEVGNVDHDDDGGDYNNNFVHNKQL